MRDMKSGYHIVAILAATIAAARLNSAHAQQPGDVSWGTNLFADRVARHAGDIVTVLVMESASSSGAVSSDTKKDETIEGGPGTGPLDFIPSFSASAKNQHQGEATLNRTERLVAKVPARVVVVLPDGTLRLEGSREIISNGEHQILRVTGLARPIDIGPENTVASSVIADARIEYSGKGVLSEGHRMSRLMRLVNWLF